MIKRKHTSDTLRQIAREIEASLRGSWPGHQPGQEDLEAVQHFQQLATRNDSGMLTSNHAKEICDILEEDNPAIIDIGGFGMGPIRWVETEI